MNEQAVYRMLMSQEFVDWYEKDFIEHVEGDGSTNPTHILNDIRSMLERYTYK